MQMRYFILSSIVSTCLIAAAFAAPISYTGGTYSQDFDALSSSVGTTVNSTIGSVITGFTIYNNGAEDNNYTVQSNTSSNLGNEGAASLGTDNAEPDNGDRSLGGREYNGQFAIGAHFNNATGGDLSQVTLSYTGKQWRAVAPAGNVNNYDLIFEYSLDATSPVDNTATWFNVSTLDFELPEKNPGSTTGLNGNLSANQASYNATFDLDSNWQDGDVLWLRWRQSNIQQGASPAIDDLSFSAVIPEPGSLLLLGLGATMLMARRR